MTINIRRAQKEDGAALLRLIDALADFEKLARPDAAARARLLGDAFREPPRFEAFLADVDGQSVGYAFVFETYSSFLALPTLYLEDLFVLPEFRGRGIGYTLFRHCVELAAERGCGRMEWSVLDWNVPAQRFYERLGARRLNEWLYYRLVREDMERILSARRSTNA
jgi:GNAT superfamily N-acetyltransferase